MAITINIYYTGLNGNARKFAEEMIAKGVVEDIRAKDGNLQYEYFLPMEDPETILLIDKWKNQEALDLHHSSPAMEKILDLRNKYMIAKGVVEDIRAKDGNLQYEYFLPMEDPETILLIDKWKNQEALDLHHSSPAMEKILDLRNKYDLHMRVERYVCDESGIPEGDRNFIKE